MKTITLTTILLLTAILTFAQGVAINENGEAPNPSAMLDVQSTEKGMLVPRMTQVQRDAISNPATGLLIYQTDNETGFHFNAGTPTSPVWHGIASSDGIWQQTGDNVYRITGNVGIGTPNTVSKLTLQGTANSPAIPGNSSNGLLRIGNSSLEAMDMGKSNSPPYAAWLQAGFNSIETDPISLNPLGGNVGIGTEAPSALLHAIGSGTGEGNILFVGEFKQSNPGNPPVDGPGTRMMWYPDKAAFRAGRTILFEWDKENIGDYSFSWGGPTMVEYGGTLIPATAPMASGDYSTAWGSNTSAYGKNATAWGEGVSAKSAYETALGRFNTPYIPNSETAWEENDRLLVIGNGTSIEEQSDALVILKNGNTGVGASEPAALLHVEGMEAGRGNVLFTGEFKPTNPGDPPAEGTGTRMMWYPDKAAFRVGEASSAAWNAQNIGNHSVAWGGPLKWENGEHYSTAPWAWGDYSTAWGARAYALGKLSTAWGGFDDEGLWPWGHGVVAYGTLSTAWGSSSRAEGYASTSWGSGNAMDDYSTAWGASNSANAKYSTVWGVGTRAESTFETALGHFNTLYSTTGDKNDWNENDRLFVIGNGTSLSDRSDALVLLKNGHMGLGNSEPESRLHLLSGQWTKTILEHQGSDHRSYLGSDNQAAVFSFNAFFQSGSGWNFPTNEPAFAFLMHRSNQRFEFRVRPEGGNLSTAMVIRVNGNTGIGITNPQHKLSVAVTTNITPNGDGIGIVNTANNNYWNLHMSSASFRFSYNNENLSYIHSTTGEYIVTSDARLKENIAQTSGMLERVKQLNVVSYNFERDATGNKTIGLLAQETKNLFPELVHKEDESDYYGISYMGLSVVAIKAIQEQQQIIEGLKAEKDAEISALSDRIRFLEDLLKQSE